MAVELERHLAGLRYEVGPDPVAHPTAARVEHEPDAALLVATHLHEVVSAAETPELQRRVLAAFPWVLGGEAGEAILELGGPDSLNAGRQPEPGLSPGSLDAGAAHWDLIFEPGADRRQLPLHA